MVLKLNIPSGRYEFETYRQLREGGDWLGCNHCGRTVPDDPDRSEHEGSLYHRYCFLKLFRREHAELIYGADVFANDPWERWKVEQAERDRRLEAEWASRDSR
jgi:hypothetical protein